MAEVRVRVIVEVTSDDSATSSRFSFDDAMKVGSSTRIAAVTKELLGATSTLALSQVQHLYGESNDRP